MPQIMQPAGQLQSSVCARFFGQSAALPRVLKLGDGLSGIKAVTTIAVKVQNGLVSFVHPRMLDEAHDIRMTNQTRLVAELT